MVTKEEIFAEFKIAKQKDLKKSTKDAPYENCFTNRLKLLKSHKDAKQTNPGVYRHLDVNFDSLITAYSSPVPVDYFYKSVFGKTYAEHKESVRVEDLTELQKEKEDKRREKEKQELKKEKAEDVKETSIN
jgi:septin family protein